MRWLRSPATALIVVLLSIVLLTETIWGSTPVWRTRCTALTSIINIYRAPDIRLVDVRLMRLLCKVGRNRARTMADAKSIWHNLNPVRRALTRWGGCWKNVGEVLASNDYSGSATAFMEQWRWSPSHWELLTGSAWNRGGGSWVNRGTRHVAVYYMLDTC